MSESSPNIGRFEVTAELGRGSMGIVHLAHDPVMGRDVAIKRVLLPNGLSGTGKEEYLQRFQREARAAGRLSHPAIVTVYDLHQTADSEFPFIAMEYVEGPTLHELISREGALNPDWVLSIGEALADGLQAAHAAGIIHRDLKPANILVRESDGVAKISDFGVARVNTSELTEVGTTYGSPAYLPPERLRGRPADGRSDLFSLAVILYEALSGTRPFGGDDFASTCAAILHDEPQPIRSQTRDLVPTFDRFFERALANDPDVRFQDAASFRDALRVLRREQEVYGRGVGSEPKPNPAIGAAATDEAHAKGVLLGLDAAIEQASKSIPRHETEDTTDRPAEVVPPLAQPSLETPSAGRLRAHGPRAALGLIVLALVVGALAFLGNRSTTQRPDPPPTSAHETAKESAPGTPPPAETRALPAEPHAPDTASPDATHAIPAPQNRTRVAPPPTVATRRVAPAPRATARAETAPGPVLPGGPAVPAIPAERASLPEGAESARAAAPASGPAFLELSVRSSIKAGTLSLLLDGQEIYSTDLATESRRLARLLKKTTGQVAQDIETKIEIPAGRHTLLARVTSLARPAGHEQSVVVLMDPGQTRRLRVHAGRAVGLEVTLD